jgi:hypothetical protein
MTRLTDVNTTDIFGAIELARNAMCSIFDPNCDDIPYFRVAVLPEAYFGIPLESHVPGRHLNALLNAEDAAGLHVDEDVIQKFTNACFYSYSGAVPFPLDRNDGEYESPTVFVPHHIREGFHALTALVKYRGSEKAEEIAAASIAGVFEYWNPETSWDYERIRGMGVVVQEENSFISGVARAIGPLVKYFRTTGYGPALDLAIMLKEKCLDGYFTDDGSYKQELFGTHAHSVTCTMSSLAQLADLTSDSTLMNLVKKFYDNGLSTMRDETGWSRESTVVIEGRKPDEGEMNNTGDILETALILGRWGYTDYFQDAERILRCHLLPSQLRDISWIPTPDNPDGLDTLRDVAQRTQGAWGFPAPFGHEPVEQQDRANNRMRFNTDVVGGTVGSLCEVLRETTRTDEAGHWVNLLFDHETPDIEVRSPYTSSALSVRVKTPAPLFVRIPSWVDRKTMKIAGTSETPRDTNGYLFFAQPPVNRPITFEYGLPTEDIVLHHATRNIRVRLRGDEVAAMENHGADLTFFEPL